MQNCEHEEESGLIIKISDIFDYKPGSRVIKKQQIAEWSERNPIQSKVMSRIIKGPAQSVKSHAASAAQFRVVIRHKHHNHRLSLAVMEREIGFPEKFFHRELKLDHDNNEIARDIDVENFGNFLISVRSQFLNEERAFLSMFVGDNLTHFQFQNARRAASSTANIIKKILDGKEVALENINLFALAIRQGKIAKSA